MFIVSVGTNWKGAKQGDLVSEIEGSVKIKLTPLDGVNGYEQRHSQTLPEREEQDTLDAKEFGYDQKKADFSFESREEHSRFTHGQV